MALTKEERDVIISEIAKIEREFGITTQEAAQVVQTYIEKGIQVFPNLKNNKYLLQELERLSSD